MINDEKVIKKVNKILRWINHSGGMNEVWFSALSVVVFRMYQEAGYEVTVVPKEEANGETGIIITDK